MTKGKARAPQHHDDADRVGYTPTHDIQELENLECSSPRYTVGQLGSRLLCMAYLDEGVPNAIIDLCTFCMQMAIGEKPCPHGTFPEDGREPPLVIWREDLVAAVKKILVELLAGPSPAPSRRSVGGEGQPGNHCVHGYPSGACRLCGSVLTSVLSVSSVSSSTRTRTSTPSQASTATGSFMNISHPSGARSCRRTHTQDSVSGGENSSRAAPSGAFPSREMLAGWDQIRDALIEVLGAEFPMLTAAPPGVAPPIIPPGPAPPVIPPGPAPPVIPPGSAPPVIPPGPAPPVIPPGPAPPVAPPAAPAGQAGAPNPPPYVARIDAYNPSACNWHVVIVGRSVGVFEKWDDVQRATGGLRNNRHASFRLYEQALSTFRAAERKGEVSLRE